jgi:hypothetical protein
MSTIYSKIVIMQGMTIIEKEIKLLYLNQETIICHLRSKDEINW